MKLPLQEMLALSPAIVRSVSDMAIQHITKPGRLANSQSQKL